MRDDIDPEDANINLPYEKALGLDDDSKEPKDIVEVKAGETSQPIPVEDVPYTEEIITQMEAELMALMKAWTDRGIPPQHCAEYLAGMAHVMLALGGYSLSEVMMRLIDRWKKYGGQA